MDDVEARIAAGDPIDAFGRHGSTPLQLAADEGFTRLVEILIRAGADVNLANGAGCTALHYAAREGRLNAANALVDRGADLDATCQIGATPAMSAADNGHREMVELLIQHGADPEIRDPHGHTALDRLAERDAWRERDAKRTISPQRMENALMAVRHFMAQAGSVEEYAARHGRGIMAFGYASYNLPDPEADRWAKRLVEILLSPELLGECEERYLEGEAREWAREYRRHTAAATARRAALHQRREQRRLGLT